MTAASLASTSDAWSDVAVRPSDRALGESTSTIENACGPVVLVGTRFDDGNVFTMPTTMPSRLAFATLAAASALPALAGDMYLAALPDIRRLLEAPAWAVQLTFTGYLLLLGLAQLAIGPLTDSHGRRRPLLIGMAVFVVGSIIAAASPNVWVLVVGRLLQGVGGGAALVVANSSVRDYVRGREAARMYAILMTIAAVAPIVAPTVGGVLTGWMGWRSVFVLLTAVGFVVVGVAVKTLRESHPTDRRSALRWSRAFGVYGRLLRTRAFMAPALALMTVMSMLFGFLGGAPYVYRIHYGIGAVLFGLLFAATGAAALAGTALSSVLARTMGERRVHVVAIALYTAGAGLLVAAVACDLPIGGVLAGSVFMAFGLGLCEPMLLSFCMNSVEADLGAASALVGSGILFGGALSATVIGYAGAMSPLAWSASLAMLALAAALTGWMSINRSVEGARSR